MSTQKRNLKNELVAYCKENNLKLADIVMKVHEDMQINAIDEFAAFDAIVKNTAGKVINSDTETLEFFKKNDRFQYIKFSENVTIIMRNIVKTTELDSFNQIKYTYEALTPDGWIKQNFAFPKALSTRIDNLVALDEMKSFLSAKFVGMRKQEGAKFEHKAFFSQTFDSLADIQNI